MPTIILGDFNFPEEAFRPLLRHIYGLSLGEEDGGGGHGGGGGGGGGRGGCCGGGGGGS